MNPESEAQELYSLFENYAVGLTKEVAHANTKEMCTHCVEKILIAMPVYPCDTKHDWETRQDKANLFWEQVREEIQKL